MTSKAYLPDSAEACQDFRCSCSRDFNKNGQGTVVEDEEGFPVREFKISPSCTLHSNVKFWLTGSLVGAALLLSGCAGQASLQTAGQIATQVGQSPTQICGAIIASDISTLQQLKAQLVGSAP